MHSEIETKADFSMIRYAQCWEDADILLQGLNIQPGQRCLAIASAGDNALAMLSKSPGQVIALDMNPAQLACLELRVAGFRTLRHPELLELIGSRPSQQRLQLYGKCRGQLSRETRCFWDARPAEVRGGIGHAGKFERFLALFRRWILPLIHSQQTIDELLRQKSQADRAHFFQQSWNTRSWRMLFRLFFSQFIIGRLGRDRRFFDYAEECVSTHLRDRAAYALVNLAPNTNAYLQWILTGSHQKALPYALRPENFKAIRDNLSRLTWYPQSVEAYLSDHAQARFDCFNLSNIFEYMSPAHYRTTLEKLVQAGNPGSRLAYWNMLVPRSRPSEMADQLRPVSSLAQSLYRQDQAFFYRDFVLEEVI